jgi:hypothetical protein
MSTDLLLQRAKALRLNGLAENWQDVHDFTWVKQLIEWEEVYRRAKSLDNRLRSARIGKFKMLSCFDWSWPKKCDRSLTDPLKLIQKIHA